MPDLVAGDPASFPTLVRVVNSSDVKTNVPITQGMDDLCDRTANLKALLDAMTTGSLAGITIKRLQRVATLAALRAIGSAARLDGDCCVVLGYGLYTFDTTSSATAADPFVVTPTDVGGGAGRWTLDLKLALDIANGVAQLDSGARIPVGKPRNGLIQLLEAHDRSTVGSSVILSTTSASLVDVPGLTVTLTGALAGDLVECHAVHGSVSSSGGSTFTVTVVDGGTPHVLSQVEAATALQTPVAHVCLYTVVNAGSIVVKLQANALSGTTIVTAQANIVARLIRP